MRRLFTFSLLLLLAACGRPGSEKVHVLTSTEVAGTGMPQLLLSRFRAESGVNAELQIVEASALRQRDYGKRAAVVITNDPETVRALAPLVRLQAVFARDGFVIVGPKSDPAHVRDAGDADEAFRRIIDSKRTFCSAASTPRFRARESQIWPKAGREPREQRRYLLCRGDGKPFFRELERRRAYALVDIAALAAVPGSDRPAVLLEGTPLLRNDYSVLLLSRRKARNAEWFVQWVMSYRGRETVEQHRIDGKKRLFVP